MMTTILGLQSLRHTVRCVIQRQTYPVTKLVRVYGTRGPYKPPEDPPHPETPQFPGEADPDWPPIGKIYDKKPWKIELVADKRYSWCSCGHSKKQPFCDGSHKKLDGTAPIKKVPKYRPIRFTVEETKDYWLCNCKQTGNRPFCDGTHKRADIQEAIRS